MSPMALNGDVGAGLKDHMSYRWEPPPGHGDGWGAAPEEPLLGMEDRPFICKILIYKNLFFRTTLILQIKITNMECFFPVRQLT